MQKLLIALAAILVTGVVGAFQVAGTDAQDARKRDRTVERDEVVIQTNGEEEEFEIVRGEDGRWQARRRVERPAAPQPGVLQRIVEREPRITQVGRPNQPQQPGTWQTVSHDDDLILLNTATGESFMLDDNDDGLFWRPIPRPGMDRPEMPRMPEWRNERDTPDRNPEQIERRLENMRERLRNARGEAREELENAIDELEEALEDMRSHDDRGDRDPERKAERERDERGNHAEKLEETIRDLKERINELNEKFEDTDSERKRKGIEEEIKGIKEKVNALKKELKGLRD